MAIEVCRPTYQSTEVAPPEKEEVLTERGDTPASETPSGAGEINIFKFEIVKACIERTFSEYEQSENDIVAFAEKEMSPAFKLAFNTLLKYEIIKEDNE
jgi:hypothetical protein